MSFHANGGGGSGESGVPGDKPVGQYAYGRSKQALGRKPTLEKTKSVSYNATTSDQIFAISATPSSTESKEQLPNAIEVQNTGGVPIFLMIGYREWTTETADAGSGEGRFEYLHIMLMPGATFSPPVRGVIRTGEADGTESKVIMDGTSVDNLAPDSNEYTDSGANVDTNDLNNTTTPITIGLDSDASVNFFRVNDIIRVSDDVMRVLGTYSDDPTDSSLAAPQIRVERGLFGSEPEAVSGTPDIRFPFFNAYHDFDKYSVAQTDSNGRFKCFNFFGQGRAASGVQGIIPGSVAFLPCPKKLIHLNLPLESV